VSGRRVALIALAVVAAAVVLVFVGRWERSHRAHVQSSGMRGVLAEIGPLDNKTLHNFRYLSGFQCLLYTRGKDPFALEICADAQGRVVEAIDRRQNPPKIWSLRDDPTRSTVRIDRREFDKLLVELGVPPRLIRIAHGQPA
jgi:hypothetical protein